MKTLVLTPEEQDTLQIVLAVFAHDLRTGRFQDNKGLSHITMTTLLDLGSKIGHPLFDKMMEAKSAQEVDALLRADIARRGL